MRAALLLLALCLGLGAVVAYQVSDAREGEGSANAPASRPAEPRAALPRIARPAARGDYARVVADNLFDPGRRPTVEAVPPAPARRRPPAAAPPRLRLMGIVGMPEGRVALLRVPRARAYRRVTEGARVEGWVIEEIGRDTVTLGRAGASAVLRLVVPKAGRAAPMPGR
jgi:hypothetical protein